MAKIHRHGITIADIASLAGLTAFAVLAGLGAFYRSTQPGLGILLAVVCAIAPSLLLQFMLYAKRTKNDLKWRTAQWATLAIYLLFACAAMPYATHFLSLCRNKSQIQETGRSDIRKVRQLFANYERAMADNLLATKEGVKNALEKSRQSPTIRLSQPLADWLDNQHITDTRDLEVWYEERTGTYIGGFAGVLNIDSLQIDSSEATAYDRWKRDELSKLQRMEQAIENWSWIGMPPVPDRLQQCAQEVATYLNEQTQEAKLPKITRKNNNGRISYDIIYDIWNYYTDNISYSAPPIEFKEKICRNEHSDISSILGIALAHLLILFPFIVAPGANTVRTHRLEEDGGEILTESI